MTGADTAVEVTNISPHGFWLLLDDEELFLAFTDFPWFAQATVAEIADVQRPAPDHLWWPSLDVDLHTDSLHSPAAYPLIARS